jgi:hypothetical protein
VPAEAVCLPHQTGLFEILNLRSVHLNDPSLILDLRWEFGQSLLNRVAAAVRTSEMDDAVRNERR